MTFSVNRQWEIGKDNKFEAWASSVFGVSSRSARDTQEDLLSKEMSRIKLKEYTNTQ